MFPTVLTITESDRGYCLHTLYPRTGYVYSSYIIYIYVLKNMLPVDAYILQNIDDWPIKGMDSYEMPGLEPSYIAVILND